MQRYIEQEKEAEEKTRQKKQITESHWRATYKALPAKVVTKPKVVYDSSYLSMPGSAIGVGRRSFKSFNKKIERQAEDELTQKKEKQIEETERRNMVDDTAMAKTLGKMSVREQGKKRKAAH
ncbi:hypothetical protein FBU59_005595 [Linderina macrospora]|uniref:Uncharacterized protein n=1 Tax=Linderina macrospora TaxID=4868 RepID=A0ACC1J2J4_9FUNG|nr:hypothetical protein FBU59_005595 [Linderina macrospora]